MKYFKFFFVTAIICTFLHPTTGVAQKVGIKLGGGLSRLGSSHLMNSMQNRTEENSSLEHAGANPGYGGHYSIGIFGEHIFSPSFSLLSDPSVNFTRSKIFLTTVSENFYEADGALHGSSRRISSSGSFRFGYVSVPILAKYAFPHNRRTYALGGFAANFVFRGRFQSHEKNMFSVYEYDAINNTYIEEKSAEAQVTDFNPVRFDFILGIGSATRLLRRDMFIELRYNLPLTRTPLVVGDIAESTYNNFIFTESGRAAALDQAPQYPLSNFNLSTLTFTIRYTLLQLDY
ncbi:outer membrane beta-barrel protein [Cytophagaceae bacterium ABcell3]|nr:outer membrane beta-barrel protein [Cytophagaceae bacterium ABcell3]